MDISVIKQKISMFEKNKRWGIIMNDKEVVAPVYDDLNFAIKEFSYFEKLNYSLLRDNRCFLKHYTVPEELQRAIETLRTKKEATMEIILL